MSENEDEELDEAQKDQDEVGEAGSDPETSGPAEKLREKAAKATGEGQVICNFKVPYSEVPYLPFLISRVLLGHLLCRNAVHIPCNL